MLSILHLKVVRHPQQFDYHFRVSEGEVAAIQGVSGVGKTTLLECIAGFVPANAGEIIWHQHRLDQLDPSERPISMLFQDHNLFEHLSVSDNLNLALGKSQRESYEKAASQLGIVEHLQKKPAQLSGGQRQRVALIRTMLRPEPLILLDEPFSELDDRTRAVATSWAREQATGQGKTMLVVTHQAEDVSRLADKVITLEAAN